MHKVIDVTLSESSIGEAIKKLKNHKNWIALKTEELLRRLAMIGENDATVRFSGAYYDGNKDVSVSVVPISNGYKIVASGDSVFFIEFGAGVYFNGEEPYPKPRPAGVVGIGEYGQGKGKQNTWGYYDDAGDLVLTHGTPAAMPMYHASRKIQIEIERIAREVFR